MFNIVLLQPEIAPNTGNIIRLCANSGAKLHLIEPLGFFLDDKKLKRAGLDYQEFATVEKYRNLASCQAKLTARWLAFTTHAKTLYHEFSYQENDVLLFGPETRGLSTNEKNACIQLRIPMQTNSRSLNLSNTVAIALYEAMRQLEFQDCY